MGTTTGVGNAQKSLIDSVAEKLVECTHSDYVLVRNVMDENDHLELVAVKKSNAAPSVLNFCAGVEDNDEGYLIPLIKEPFWYDVADPMSYQGVMSLTLEKRDELFKFYTDPREQRFIGWISEKAYFPLRVDNTVFLVTLLRHENTPYTFLELDFAFFTAAVLLKELETPQINNQSGVLASNEHLCSVIEKGMDNALLEFAHTLTQERGLNWNQVCIFELSDETAQGRASFSPSVILQSSNHEHNNLEIVFNYADNEASVSQSQNDRIFRKEELAQTLEKIRSRLKPRLSSTGVFRPILCRIPELEDLFRNELRSILKIEHPVWFMLFYINNEERYLIALSSPDADELYSSPIIESASFLRYMQFVLPNWLANE